MISATKWLWRGLFNYTKSAYEKKSTRFIPEHLTSINYNETNFIVTGANSGIGYAVALDLATKGGRVHIVCRNKERGEQALLNIIQESGSENVFLHIHDLSKKSDVNQMVKSFVDSGERIDVLILNAGVMMQSRTTTDEGHEMTFATNLLGPYLLTSQLLPHLKRMHADRPENKHKARVIFVSSGGALTQRMHTDFEFTSSGRWNPTITYAQTKRALIYLTELFSEHFSEYNTNFYSMHPGWVSTPQLTKAMPTFNYLTKSIQRTPQQGGDTIVWLAVSPTVENETGGFYEDRELTAKHLTKDTESSRDDIEKLWNYLDKCSKDDLEQQPNEQPQTTTTTPNSNSDTEQQNDIVEGETHPMKQ